MTCPIGTIAVNTQCVAPLACPIGQASQKQCGLCAGDPLCTDDCVLKCVTCPDPLIEVNGKCVPKKDCHCNEAWEKVCGLCTGRSPCHEDCKQTCKPCNTNTHVMMDGQCVPKIVCPLGEVIVEGCPDACVQVCKPCDLTIEILINGVCAPKRTCENGNIPRIECGHCHGKPGCSKDCIQVCNGCPHHTLRLNGRCVAKNSCPPEEESSVVCGLCTDPTNCLPTDNCKQQCISCPDGTLAINGQCDTFIVCPVGEVPTKRCGLCDGDVTCVADCEQVCSDCPGTSIALNGRCVKELKCLPTQQSDIVCGFCQGNPLCTANCKQICVDCIAPKMALNGVCVDRIDCPGQVPAKVCGSCNGVPTCIDDCKLECRDCPAPQIEVNQRCLNPLRCPGNQVSTKNCDLCAGNIGCTDDCELKCQACDVGKIKLNNMCVDVITCALSEEVATVDCKLADDGCTKVCTQVCKVCKANEVKVGDICAPKLPCKFPLLHLVICVGQVCKQVCNAPVCDATEGLWTSTACEYTCQAGVLVCKTVPFTTQQACLCRSPYMRENGACVSVGGCLNPTEPERPSNGAVRVCEFPLELSGTECLPPVCEVNQDAWTATGCENTCSPDGNLICSPVASTLKQQCLCSPLFMRQGGDCVDVSECKKPDTIPVKPVDPDDIEGSEVVEEVIEVEQQPGLEAMINPVEPEVDSMIDAVEPEIESMPVDPTTLTPVESEVEPTTVNPNEPEVDPTTMTSVDGEEVEPTTIYSVDSMIEEVQPTTVTPEETEVEPTTLPDVAPVEEPTTVSPLEPEDAVITECPFPMDLIENECMTPICDENEEPWSLDGCENICSNNGNVTCEAVDVALQQQCICGPGFMRQNGTCVDVADCLAPEDIENVEAVDSVEEVEEPEATSCEFPMELIEGVCYNPECSNREDMWTAAACEYTCENRELSCNTVDISVQQRCLCGPNFMRQNGTCVNVKQCIQPTEDIDQDEWNWVKIKP